ncbi:unnamed protein product [Paramecium sonneborni]|uniref:Uncharacterized protein n=1 Tax=Paramecium sonneborni TaxID=65129 RepID=A0A8S1R6A6_9CILI|nr:unnamed protein product [Paramecium sonneborni]
MNEFNQMFQQAVAIKSHEMHSKRKVFEKQPLFIKAGLYYLNEYIEQRKLDIEQRLNFATELKENGNKLFQQGIKINVFTFKGKFGNASHEYEKSLSIFLYIENKNGNWKNEGIVDDDLTYRDDNSDWRIMDIRIKLLLNLSICYIKEKQFKDAIAACDYVLNIQDNAKAYYRRAKARLDNINAEESDYKQAIEDLEKALQIDDDEAIRKDLTKAKLELKKMMRSSIEISQNVMKNIEKTSFKEIEQSQKQQEIVDEDSSSEEEECEYSEDWKKYSFNTLSYEPSFEEDTSIQVAEEINELGKFIESRGVQILHLYETQGKHEEAEKHRQFLAQLMAAKMKIERISKSNFSKPIINEKATQFGIDLSDPIVQEEFQQLFQQNMRDLRKWLKEQNWKMRKSKIIKKVNKLAKKEKEVKMEEETGTNSKYDLLVLGICAFILLLSLYYYIFD